MKNDYFQSILAIAFICLSFSCKKYLDIVPDDVATINNAFTDQSTAQRYLFTLYSFVPDPAHPETNPGFNAGDEFWIYWPIDAEDYSYLDPYNIARGLQNTNTPYMDYWDGYDVPSLWQGIRDCNIFLQNVDNVPGLAPFLKNRWIAEAQFLKAYFHWYLFRMYGPIPIVDKNISVSSPINEIRVMQQPVDSVVNYIANLMDTAAVNLPDKITNVTTELGRITRPAALAIKARLLVTAASPLFNGNTDYTGFKNKAGVTLFNPVYEKAKWERAAEACKEAIDACTAAGITLYHFTPPGIGSVDSATQNEMTIRNAVCDDQWSSGLIWGYTIKPNATTVLQEYACPHLDPTSFNLTLKGQLAPTLRMAELFYSKHGVPINEDKTYDYAGRFNLRTTTPDDSTMQDGYQMIGLNFDRGPRFYADLAFDGAKMFMNSQTWTIQSELGQTQGKKQSRLYSITGYFCKKVINWNLVAADGNVTIQNYPWPIMRLADLYLLYAECLNEIGEGNQAILWVDSVRARVGLKGVEESWNDYSNNPGEWTTTDGLRNIIHQERLIEMAFEGSRFWDLRRWKEAGQMLNAPIYGWNILGNSPATYNQKVLLFDQTFVSPRDYLWPIKENDLVENPNLVQNPGW